MSLSQSPPTEKSVIYKLATPLEWCKTVGLSLAVFVALYVRKVSIDSECVT